MTQQEQKDTQVRIMRWGEVEHLTGMPASTIRHLVLQDRFPKPVQLSTHAAGFFSDEVSHWMEELRGKRIQYHRKGKPTQAPAHA